MVFPKHRDAIAVIRGSPILYTVFAFMGHLYYITHGNRDSTEFTAFRSPDCPFLVPRCGNLYETVLAFQRALRVARWEQPQWWGENPTFHSGLDPFPMRLRRS
jgi:hypothetical protein